jgi:hypothetical protein
MDGWPLAGTVELTVFKAAAVAVVVVHGAFLVYVAGGGFLAWRWPRLLWPHVAAVAWAVGIVAIGWPCPLTALERWLVRAGGGTPAREGFVDRFVEGVVVPESLTPVGWAIALAAIASSWSGAAARRRRAERIDAWRPAAR